MGKVRIPWEERVKHFTLEILGKAKHLWKKKIRWPLGNTMGNFKNRLGVTIKEFPREYAEIYTALLFFAALLPLVVGIIGMGKSLLEGGIGNFLGLIFSGGIAYVIGILIWIDSDTTEVEYDQDMFESQKTPTWAIVLLGLIFIAVIIFFVDILLDFGFNNLFLFLISFPFCWLGMKILKKANRLYKHPHALA